VADVTKNFPADAGILAGGSVTTEMPITTLRVSGSGTITPYVYICDQGNNRIQVFDYDLVFLWSFGEYGTGQSS
jgi:hypothetical protein